MVFCFLGFFVGGYIRQYILLKKGGQSPPRLMIFSSGFATKRLKKKQLMSRATKNLKIKKNT